MFEQCRILDKLTGKIYYGQIDWTFIGHDFYNLVKIPDDGNNYIWNVRKKTYEISKDSPKPVNNNIQEDIIKKDARFQAGIFLNENLCQPKIKTNFMTQLIQILQSILGFKNENT